MHVPGDSMKSCFIKTVSKEGGKAEGFAITEFQMKAGGSVCNIGILNKYFKMLYKMKKGQQIYYEFS